MLPIVRITNSFAHNWIPRGGTKGSTSRRSRRCAGFGPRPRGRATQPRAAAAAAPRGGHADRRLVQRARWSGRSASLLRRATDTKDGPRATDLWHGVPLRRPGGGCEGLPLREPRRRVVAELHLGRVPGRNHMRAQSAKFAYVAGGSRAPGAARSCSARSKRAGFGLALGGGRRPSQVGRGL